MKLGLLSKMLLFILAPVLLGTVILTSVSYYMGDSMIQDQIDNDSKIVLDTAGTGIDAIFTGIRETLIFLSQNARILKAISAYAEGGPQAFTEELRDDTGKVFYNFVQSSALIRGSLLIGADGLVLSGSLQGQPHAKEEVGKNYSERNFFRTAVQEGRTSYTTIFLPSGEVQIMLAEPIRKDGRIIGVVSCRLLSAFVSKQTTDRVHVGRKGQTYAYNYQGKIILADQGKVGRDDAMLPHVRTMIQQKEGKLVFKSNDGEKFMYFKDLPQLRWILCVEVDKSEIMAPTYSLLRNLTLCAVVIGLIIGGIIFFAAKSMASSVGGIAGLANAVAGGRLEATASEEAFMTQTERRGDELSTLSTAMRKMILNLKKLMEESEEKTHAAEQATRDAQEATKRAEEATKVAERAKRDGMLDAASRLESMVKGISEAAGELSAQIEQSDRGSQQSSQRLSEAATAMNEMNATVQEVAQNASSASNFSSRTKGNAEEGQKILTNAMSSISQARNVSMELKDDMSKLHEHTQNISQIMNVISDIADQTNLLALNAAIEAARAGEAGRGFAVVADEVRKLAEKTMASTNDVSQAITAIQSSAQQSVNRMEEALQNVEQATISAQQSGEALNKIVSDVEETADQVRAIATASEEQSAASEEITQSIANVADMSSQTTQSMSEAARAISDLAEQTTRLSTLIEEMKQG